MAGLRQKRTLASDSQADIGCRMPVLTAQGTFAP
jgi:hypothetical protein